MEKTFLITNSYIFPAKISKWVNAFIGLILCINGVSNIARGGWIGIALGILLIIAGLFFALYSFVVFSEQSKYAPRLKFNNDYIEIKEGILKSAVRIPWSEIKSIVLGSFNIRFNPGEEETTLPYNTNAKISIAMKRAIREMAEKKNIEVYS